MCGMESRWWSQRPSQLSNVQLTNGDYKCAENLRMKMTLMIWPVNLLYIEDSLLNRANVYHSLLLVEPHVHCVPGLRSLQLARIFIRIALDHRWQYLSFNLTTITHLVPFVSLIVWNNQPYTFNNKTVTNISRLMVEAKRTTFTKIIHARTYMRTKSFHFCIAMLCLSSGFSSIATTTYQSFATMMGAV